MTHFIAIMLAVLALAGCAVSTDYDPYVAAVENQLEARSYQTRVLEDTDFDRLVTAVIGTLNTNHSLVKGQNPAGTNNLDATAPGFDPGFVAESLGNYHLTEFSPLLDVADAMSLPVDSVDLDDDGDTAEVLPTDIENLFRESGPGLDIGPHERQIGYVVGGTLINLLFGNSITLQNNDGDDLTLMDNGAFTFTTPVLDHFNYAVAITQAPNNPPQSCTINLGSGTVASTDVTSVEVVCEIPPLIFADGFE